MVILLLIHLSFRAEMDSEHLTYLPRGKSDYGLLDKLGQKISIGASYLAGYSFSSSWYNWSGYYESYFLSPYFCLGLLIAFFVQKIW